MLIMINKLFCPLILNLLCKVKDGSLIENTSDLF